MNIPTYLKTYLFVLCILPSLLKGQQSMNMTLSGVWDGNTIQHSGNYYNDIWGYTDELGNEYAIVGSPTKVHFIDVTNPTTPTEIHNHTGGNTSLWRDFKSYKKHVYAVADEGSEGMLIFDMSGLPASPPTLVNQVTGFGRAHNIFIDVPNGLLYVAGSNFAGGGVMVYDLNTDPANPTLVFSNSLSGGYVHDIYVKDNIAYASHGFSGLYMYDFSNPSSPFLIDSRFTGGYNHSSWITDDDQYVVYAEEVPDGRPLGILDISDIPNNGIELVRTFKFPLLAPQETNVTPHNPFIAGDYCIVSYYEDGVQIFDISDKNNPVQVAWYDTEPNNTTYGGTNNNWGVYPYFPSGNIIATDTDFGLFVLSTSLNIPTTCNDGIQNGTELGVDCGGFCKSCPQAPVASFTANTTSNCTGVISFTDQSSGALASWLWDFGDGKTSTQQNPTHTYTNAGTFSVSLTVTNSAGANTDSKANYITITTPPTPTVTDGSFCAPGATTLFATVPSGVINWFDNNGNYLATGTDYTTPILNNTTTYYAQAASTTTQYVGPSNSNIGGGEFHNTSAKYLIFNVSEALTLQSVWVNSNQPGNRTIELRDGNDSLINSQTMNIPNGMSRISLNYNLSPGDYQLGGDNMNLFRNNAGVNFPYTISNLIEITTSTKGPNHYYYFYDWEIQTTDCTGPQVPVQAAVAALPISNFTYSITGNTVSFFDVSLNTASVLWDFGDGNTSTQANPTHTYSAPGTYTVNLTAFNSCGISQLRTKTISVPQIKVSLTVYLEGAYDPGFTLMTTGLQQLSLMPTTGQPYGVAPWNYPGTEGAGWQPSDYPMGSVDWVLVSLRTTEDAATTVGKAAGVLLQNGMVSVDIQPISGTVSTNYYVVVEHRNHLPVMSAQPVAVVNNEVSFNFTSADSYISGAGFGQKNDGIWMMYAGNGSQPNTVGHEITGSDIIEWQLSNGNFNVYGASDFNLNGDINANDKTLWSANNGIYSTVPK